MQPEKLTRITRERESLSANAVSRMAEYVQDCYPAAYPDKEQTEAVNDYLRSGHADGSGGMSERNREHRRIVSRNIPIAAIRVLDGRQLDRSQNVPDHIAYLQGVLYAGEGMRHAPLTFSFGYTNYKTYSN